MHRFNAATDDRPIWPRNPWPIIPRPISVPYFDVRSDIPVRDGPPTQWSPYGIFQSIPYRKPDNETGRLANTRRQTDFYDSSPNPWPNNGQYDHPNGYFAELLRLRTHTSAHPGKSLSTGGGPTMYFKAPPVFSLQTKPIPAVGV